ncbi:hypothetical protein H2199_005546 [Coniosporium tulheliwenetii]|uniref:Uncharacterized protein n=1 Tax=Coniosporium tulheliwenetii TaxID=3383036 RepID=A0ACC2Z1U6_9PEZI|nr:hypothetical protein H2199_005546 [Cladosporium sp. JES 115]
MNTTDDKSPTRTDDDLFNKHEEEEVTEVEGGKLYGRPRPQEQPRTTCSEYDKEEATKVEVVDGIYTVLDEANKVASKMALAIAIKFNSRRINNQLKKIEAKKTMREYLRMLEETEVAFHNKVVVMTRRSDKAAAAVLTAPHPARR